MDLELCHYLLYDTSVVSICNRMQSTELIAYYVNIADSREIDNFRFYMHYGW